MTIRVAELSVDELRTLIREVVTQTMEDVLRDPDEGLALRPETEDALRYSLRMMSQGSNTVTAENVAEQLGLKW
ncbi:MAG: hypothetical protein KJZ86_03535 [Caldilineaceae bacterium]|nr:hypothetical protein [Caldilineaceae bacterium]HRJ41623.1 hypothetical protein [Caldilineaceae bacterium]